MINLRYHIVSITAVFLALGIGLTLGSTFLDRVTVDTLKRQLETVQGRVDDSRARNGVLTDQVSALTERDVALSAELPERLLAGHLDAVPVLVIATRGSDEDLVRSTMQALAGAGARVTGTWWLTDRWLLDDADHADQLASLLELTSTRDPDRLRRVAAIRLAELLNGASAAPPVDPTAQPVSTPPDGEPALVAALKAAGFLDYEAVAGSGERRALLPGASARYVVVSGALPDSGPQLIAGSLLAEMVAAGTAPVVAAQGEVDLKAQDGRPASTDARRTTFVGALRDGELTRQRLSTVDDLDTAAGLAAVVLALEDLGGGRVGHYGSASSAARLLPAEPAG
ncbi:MAG: copper transporter [Microthrixaceae bacterium]